MKESAQHQKAFEVYYGMGPQRSLAGVAARLNVSVGSVKLWSSSFGWSQRIAERDQALAAAVEQKSTRAEMDRTTRNRRIVEASLLRGARAVADGEVKPTFADLAKLIQLDTSLAEAGDPRDVLERQLRSMPPEELRALARSELRELASLLGEKGVLEVLDNPEEPLDRTRPD